MRFECDGLAEVVVFDSEFLFRGEVRDISLNGCYIETRARLNLKRFAEVELRFTVDGAQLCSIAKVIEIRPGKGVGIGFQSGDTRMDKSLRRLIERLSATAESKHCDVKAGLRTQEPI